MGKLKTDEKGFSAVEVILVLGIVALISVVGYMVYHNHKNKTTPVASTTATKTATTTPAKTATAPDPYAGWQSYTLKYEKLAFKYPASWTIQDDSGAQGLTPNTDSITLTASDGFNVNIDDGWDGGGDSLNLATDTPMPVTYMGNTAYFVFSHPRCFGPDACDANALKGATFMLKPSSQYGQNNTAGYFPQDKNAHGDPNVNNGGSTMLIGAYYSGTNAKTFSAIAQAESDPEFKNAALFIQSMHY